MQNALVTSAESLIQEKQLPQARQVLMRCIRDYPQCDAALGALAVVEALEGKLLSSLELLHEALLLAPLDPEQRARKDLIQARLDRGGPSPALGDADFRAALLCLPIPPPWHMGTRGVSGVAGSGPREPRISIIIPVYNQVHYTKQCLETIWATCSGHDYEVIVIDDCSSDGTYEYLESVKDRVRSFRNATNQGFILNCNFAATQARGEYLVLLNNDTIPQDNWLQGLLEPFEFLDRVAATGALMIHPDHKILEAASIVFSDGSGWNFGRGENPRAHQYNYIREADYVSGGGMMIPRKVWQELGGLDTHYCPAYYDDIDFCFKARQAGYKVIYTPFSRIIHFEGMTGGTDVTKGVKRYQVINQAKFRERWKDELQRQHENKYENVHKAARRGEGRRILWIDHCLPFPNFNSGCLRMNCLLKAMLQLGAKVTYVTLTDWDPENYKDKLRKMGVETQSLGYESWEHSPKVAAIIDKALDDLEARNGNYDIIYLSFHWVAKLFLSQVRRRLPAAVIYVDSHDIHFLRERREAELSRNPVRTVRAEQTRNREIGVYARADAVMTVTELDRESVLKELPNAVVLLMPNAHAVDPSEVGFAQRQDLIFVGGYNHTPNVDAMLYFCREIFPKVKQVIPEMKLWIVGSNPTDEVKALANESIVVTGWVNDTKPYLDKCRISIAPLRYGAGMKGKIGEALSHGLPVITTPIGSEGMGIVNEEHAIVVETVEDWVKQIARLYHDESLWRQLSGNGLELMAKRYGTDKMVERAKCVLELGSREEVAALSPCPAKNTHATISIVILTHNQLAYTKECLQSIQKFTPEPHEIVFVDNFSTDGTGRWLRNQVQEYSNYVLIENSANLGFSKGCNQGLAAATGEYVLLLNNDVVVTENWLSGMLACLHREPGVGIVGPRSNCVSGKQQVEAPTYQTLEELPAFAATWVREHAGQTRPVHRVVGFCLLACWSVVDRIGGLDEQFGSGNFEDDDFCMRAHLAGFETRIADDSFVHHAGSATFKGEGMNYSQAMLTNWRLFKRKWSIAPETPPFPGYRTPDVAPPGLSLKLPLPDLKATHQVSPDGRCWADRVPPTAAALKVRNQNKPITLPPCAHIGHFGEARQFFNNKKLPAAWGAARAALKHRPFHPEAYLLMAEIALAAHDAVAARACAQYARQIAPEFKPAKKFLKANLHGNLKPEWIVLPDVVRDSHATRRPHLSVCLIVKNEERFLSQCLASVEGLADQIVVVDTGSTDRTVEIAKHYKAEVHSFTWCDDFSAARNAALEHVTGDWVLMLDADEELPLEQHEALRKLLRAAPVISWRLPLQDVGREAEGCSYVPRLFRNAPGLFYVGRVHEQVFTSLEVRRQEWGLETRMGDAMLRHYGYTKELTLERDKVGRNLRLLELAVLETPGEANLLMNFGLELTRSGRPEEGLRQYRAAFEAMADEPPALVVPESRETLLTQFATQLMAANRHAEIVSVLTSPLAKLGIGLTASLHFTLGLAQMELKEFALAAEQFRQCLAKRDRAALTPVNLEIRKAGPRHCLALCLAQAKDTAAAEREFELARKDDPESVAVVLDYARFLHEQGQSVEGLQLLHQFTSEHPQAATAWLAGGAIALSRAEFLEVAVDWTAEALRHFPEDAGIQSQRAESLLLSGQTEAALPLWRQLAIGGKPSPLGALILCETAVGKNECAPPPELAGTVTQEFVNWYRRLLDFGAEPTVLRVNAGVAGLERVLPRAAELLRAVIADVGQKDL